MFITRKGDGELPFSMRNNFVVNKHVFVNSHGKNLSDLWPMDKVKLDLKRKSVSITSMSHI
jgi:hypothetical protein